MKTPENNNELTIAEDVRTVGLSNLVAQKWAGDPLLRLPPSIPDELRNRLILTKIQTVLTQLEFFQPFTGTPTFKQLHDWMYPPPPKGF